MAPLGPALGSLVAGFRIESLVAEGSTGSVYAADDLERGGRVALKLLHPALAEDERFRKRFLRESGIAATLESPYVVPTVASGEVYGLLFLAMVYIDGPDLRTVLRAEGRLDTERALRIVEHVAEALDTAHAAGLVHRDVKPGNILLESRPEGEHAYVCDFGLARHLSSAGSLTGDRGFVGTIDYVPPEQIEGGTIDGRADLYALGCVLFQCLTGQVPFDRDSDLAVVYAHLNEPPPRVSLTGASLPQAFDDVFQKALAKNPGARYSTCGELVAAARDALAGRSSGRRRRRRAAIAGVGALAAIGSAAALVVARADSPRPPMSAQPSTPEITQSSIDGVALGLPAADYTRAFAPSGANPGYGTFKDIQTGYTSLVFGRRNVAVYFAPKSKHASIITTWNEEDRTAEGIGPCSTVEEMKRAYGDAVQPTWAGTFDNGTVWSWALGDNLLFNSQNHETITAVALYEGDPQRTRSGSPQSYANYVSSSERWCVPT